MSDDFEWNAENEDVVQHSVQGVAAYINAYGNITIRQERNWDEDQDTIVVLTVDSARGLAEKLKELINSYQA
ncbi:MULTISPECIES: hypothetical protein [unclassified Sphingopyxis]|jgi:hypothetical protein|uniref:hypothetical protein n=1 Tax=unclassified Sphingopyxis TaxID=2614943 RepID=UPI0006BF8DF3|nr:MULTISPECIES: hypothetical protein [unclassified Sphingopyxis]USI78093.1 hypothetical protein KEC45_04095 [Sphingopyxis sp. USTB-05]GAO79525.1 hypothetical protein SC1_02846 [Sphingopyxis sp. C-1]